MRTSTKTLLTLWEWSQIIGISPFWTAQILDNVPQRGNVMNVMCEHTSFQFAYQNFDYLSREEIAQAIADAEDLFAEITGYHSAPKYVVAEKHSYPTSYNRQFPITYGMRASSGQFKSIQVKHGFVQVVGSESLTSIGNAAVVLSDETSSGIDDTFTATIVVPSGTLPAAIAAFFLPADRVNLSLEESEIKPLNVSIAGVNCTITGHISLLVLPELQLTIAPQDLDAADNAIYASSIVVYTRATDISDTGTVIWGNLTPCDTPPCEATIATACFGVRDLETGWLAPLPAEWDTTLDQFNQAYPCCVGRDPDRVTVNYLAGFPRQDNGRMDFKHAQAIAKLATSLIPNRTCGCARADQRLYHYKKLPVDDQGNLQVPRELMEEAGEMLGNMGRGAVEAWSFIKKRQQWSAVNLNG